MSVCPLEKLDPRSILASYLTSSPLPSRVSTRTPTNLIFSLFLFCFVLFNASFLAFFVVPCPPVPCAMGVVPSLPGVIPSLPACLPPCRLPRGGVGSVQCQIAGSWAKCQLLAPSSPPAPIFLPLWLVPLLSSPLPFITPWSSSQLSVSLFPSSFINYCFHTLATFFLSPYFSISSSLLLLFSSFHFFPILAATLSFSHCTHLSPCPLVLPPSFCMSECSHFCMDTGLMLSALALPARNRVWGKETNSQAPCGQEGAQHQIWGLSRKEWCPAPTALSIPEYSTPCAQSTAVTSFQISDTHGQEPEALGVVLGLI